MRFLVPHFHRIHPGEPFLCALFPAQDKGQSRRTAKALTVRVVLSIALFALLLLGFHFGFITNRL